VLDPWIIEEIRRREQEERRRHEERERPGLELPHIGPASPRERAPESDSDADERGVVIVDFRV
jgi:hypothetical protein